MIVVWNDDVLQMLLENLWNWCLSGRKKLSTGNYLESLNNSKFFIRGSASSESVIQKETNI